MIKLSVDSPIQSSISDQVEFPEQKKSNWKAKTKVVRINNFEVHFQLAFLILFECFSLFEIEQNDNFAITRIALEGACAIIIILCRNKINLKYQKIALAFTKILVLSQLILEKDNKSLPVVILILMKTQNNFNYKFDGVVNILMYILLLIIVLVFWNYTLLTISQSSVVFMEIYQIYICIKKERSTEQTNQDVIQSLKMHDDIWKTRIQLIPIPIILVSKSDLNITFQNNITNEQFKDARDSTMSVENFILFHLQFSVIQNNLDQIYGSTLNFLKRVPRKSRLASHQVINEVELFQKSNLKILLDNFRMGMYNGYLSNIKTGSLEIVCSQVMQNGKQVQLSGRIMSNDEDKEFIIILNDTSKQNEFQQFIARDEFKTRMIESFSHELKTPLNSAINFLSTVLQEPTICDEIKDSLIYPALHSLRLQSYIINDVIDFSQFYNHTIELSTKEISLTELISELTSLFEFQFAMKNLGFRIIIAEKCLDTIITDQARLMQILVNILQNSLKFSLQGQTEVTLSSPYDQMIKFTIKDTGIGITRDTLEQIQNQCQNISSIQNFSTMKMWKGFGLIISTILLNQLAPKEHKQFNIKVQAVGTKVSFYIQNQRVCSQNSIRREMGKNPFMNEGRGTIIIVANQNLNKIKFNPSRCSFRSYKSIDEVSDFCSSSLIKPEKIQQIFLLQPLLITDINKSMADKKSFESCNSKEKQIGIDVLRARESIAFEEKRKQFIKNQKCSCRRILSVDDEIFNQKSIQYLISRLGFEVLLAFNGQEALEIVKSLGLCSKQCKPLTLILMDYQMPIMDGIETTIQLKQLMQSGEIPEVHIIGLTAFTSNLHIKNCIEAGMSEVLSKPLNMKDFEEILQSC